MAWSNQVALNVYYHCCFCWGAESPLSAKDDEAYAVTGSSMYRCWYGLA